MIYPPRTTVAFIFTLFIAQISRALPQTYSEHISPASSSVSVQHHLSNDVVDQAQWHTLRLSAPSESAPGITHDSKYDNPNISMSTVACSNPLEPRYPLFGDIPNFPYIGGAFDVVERRGSPSPNCGACWKLTNLENEAVIYLTAIDSAPDGFKIGVLAYDTLKGDGGEGALVDIVNVPPHYCGF